MRFPIDSGIWSALRNQVGNRGSRRGIPGKRKNETATALTIQLAARPAYRNLNPYNGLLYRSVSRDGSIIVHEHKYSTLPWRYDVVHLHWPEYDVLPGSARQILKMIVAWAWLLLAHVGGVRIVWTAHNTFAHDKARSGLTLFMWKRFLSILDGVIFLSEEGQRIITAEHPNMSNLPFTLSKHGHFQPWVAAVRGSGAKPTQEVVDAIERCGEHFVVLNFGVMRPYKNVDELMRVFLLLNDPNARLLVAGQVPDKDYLAKLEALAKCDQRIVLLPKRLDDASLVACLDRADLAVLPFRETLNSGSALMALSFGKHVVVPSIGSMRSLQRDVGADAITLFDASIDADVLRTSIERVRSNCVAQPNLRAYDWLLLGNQMVEFYHRIAGGGHGARSFGILRG